MASLGLPIAAAAQYRQAGTGVDILPSRQRQLEEAIEQARWSLGQLRVAPWIGISDVSYVRGERRGSETGASGDGQSDLTATFGAGLRAYLNAGKSVVAAHALPEYSWWQEQDERNTVIGRYGVGWFGFFNRLETEVTAKRIEDVGFLSPDLLVRQPLRSDALAASAQVRLGGATALFASGSSSRVRVEDPKGLSPAETSRLLDRDATTWRGGVRYLLRGDLGHLGAGVQSEEVEFLDAGQPRSNEGSGWYTEAQLRGNRMSVSLDYAQRELEARGDSTFPGFDRGTGQAVLAYHPSERFQTRLYGLRDLSYSAIAIERFFEEERFGAGLTFRLGRGALDLFYETGENRFFGSSPAPDEEVTGYGAAFDVMLGRYFAARVGSRETRFEPDGGPPREVREVIGALALTLGRQRGEW